MPECVVIRLVSFNFGMQQSMLESTKRWNNHHVKKFRDLLVSLGTAASTDFVFGSEVGDKGKGFRAANMNF